jgi:hypothetical protein
MVEPQNYFFIFQPPVLTTMPERSQAVPSCETIIRESMCPAGYPENTRLACTLGTSETDPFHSCHGFQVPSKLGLQAPAHEAQPQYSA